MCKNIRWIPVLSHIGSKLLCVTFKTDCSVTPISCSPHGGHWAVLTHTGGVLPEPSVTLSTRRLWLQAQAQPTVGQPRSARSYCSRQPVGTEAGGETSSFLANRGMTGRMKLPWSTAPRLLTYYWLSFLSTSSIYFPHVPAGFNSNISYWYLSPRPRVCFLDNWIESLRRDAGSG